MASSPAALLWTDVNTQSRLTESVTSYEKAFAIEGVDDVCNINSITHATCVHEGENIVALGYDMVLAILLQQARVPCTTPEVVAEVEFDDIIRVIRLDENSRCIIIALRNGSIHFVSMAGEVMLSNRVPMANNDEVIAMHLMEKSADNAAIVLCTKNGEIIGIQPIPITTICHLYKTQKAALGKAASKLTITKLQISFLAESSALPHTLAKIEMVKADEDDCTYKFVALTHAGHVITGELDDKCQSVRTQHISEHDVVDFACTHLPSFGQCVIMLVDTKGTASIRVVQLSNCDSTQKVNIVGMYLAGFSIRSSSSIGSIKRSPSPGHGVSLLVRVDGLSTHGYLTRKVSRSPCTIALLCGCTGVTRCVLVPSHEDPALVAEVEGDTAKHFRNGHAHAGELLCILDRSSASITGYTFSAEIVAACNNALMGFSSGLKPVEEGFSCNESNLLLGYLLAFSSGTKDDGESTMQLSPSLFIEAIERNAFTALNKFGDLLACAIVAANTDGLSMDELSQVMNILDRRLHACGNAVISAASRYFKGRFRSFKSIFSIASTMSVKLSIEINRTSTAGDAETEQSEGGGMNDAEGEKAASVAASLDEEAGATMPRLAVLLHPPGYRALFEQCISTGCLSDASVMYQYFIDPDDDTYRDVKRMLSLLQKIPVSSDSSQLLQFIQTHIMEVIFDASVVEELPEAPRFVARELSRRALIYESEASSDAALAVAQQAAEIMSSHIGICSSGSMTISGMHEHEFIDLNSNALHASNDRDWRQICETCSTLALQQQLLKMWNASHPYAEVLARGLNGLLFERLWTVQESTLVEDIQSHVVPLLQYFDTNVDLLLLKWVELSIEQKVIVVDAGGKSDNDNASLDGSFHAQDADDCDNDDETDQISLTRLMMGTSVVGDSSLRAKAILLLLQVPSVDTVATCKRRSRFCSRSFDDGSVQESLGSAFGEVDGEAGIADRLRALALEVIPQVESALRDSLTEALRLQRIKSLASQYGIESLDPRDKNQIRKAASLISAQYESDASIRDAIEVVQAWSMANFDLTALLTRALVHRATATGTDDFIDMHREDIIKAALADVPRARLTAVAEDTLTCLLGMLDEFVGNAAVDDVLKDTLGESDVSVRREMGMICESAITIVSWYLEEARNTEAANSGICNRIDAPATLSAEVIPSIWIDNDILNNLKRIRSLQSEFCIYLNMSKLLDANESKSILLHVAGRRAESMIAGDSPLPAAKDRGNQGKLCGDTRDKEIQRSFDATACVSSRSNDALTVQMRRLCTLLEVSPVLVAHAVLKSLLSKNASALAIEVASTLTREGDVDASAPSIEETVSTANEDAPLLMDAAISLCALGGKQATALCTKLDAPAAEKAELASTTLASFQLPSSLLHRTAIICEDRLLDKCVDLLSASDYVLSVFHRIEGHLSELSDSPGTSSQSSVAFEPTFTRDGILMSVSSILPQLLKYSVREVQRRSAASLGGSAGDTKDLDDLLTTLQRSENHMLAIRALLSSWCHDAVKSESMKACLLALSRKVLAYRSIDATLAVGCLLMLPYDMMVRELKLAVPSIQSDFGRLRTMAIVGEELAQMWDEENLLIVFQSLQANAKWWHTLTSYGVQIDSRAFHNSDSAQREASIRGIVPILLDKTNLDLDQALEYCRQFDIEPEFASLCYIEKLLLQPPTSPVDCAWAKLIRRRAKGVEERALLGRFRSVLPEIHPLDYEKIRFVCLWLVGAMNDDLDNEDDSRVDFHVPPQDRDASRSGMDLSRSNLSSASIISHDASSSATNTSLSAEAEMYKMYIEITAFLTDLRFPPQVLKDIEECDEIYDVPVSYTTRLPLWNLIEDPWAILEPIMTDSPEGASQLAPLCTRLHLSRDEFFGRRALANYERTRCSREKLSTHEEKVKFMQDVDDLMITVVDPMQKVDIWKQIFEKEVNRDDVIALLALEEALKEVRQHSSYARGSNAKSDDVYMVECESAEAELISEHAKISVKQKLASLTKSTDTMSELLQYSSLLPLLHSFSALTRRMFEGVVETAWNIQLRTLRRFGAVLTAADIAHQPLASSTSNFLTVASVVLQDVTDFCKALSPDEDCEVFPVIPNKANDTAPQTTSTTLESVRHMLIGKLLADVDPLSGIENKVSDSSRSHGNQASKAASKKGLWGREMTSALKPTDAELRRRDDLFLSFAIAVLINSCADIDAKTSYVNHLRALGGGASVKTMRRLTARSRLRAVQSLNFLCKGGASAATEKRSMSAPLHYLNCLAELQETRVLCSEQSLADALGVAMSNLASESEVRWIDKAEPGPLVQTWLHDEGASADAVELARDVLVAAVSSGAARAKNQKAFQSIWSALLLHMVRQGHLRSLLQTLLMIRTTSLLQHLCSEDTELGKGILTTTVRFFKEAVEKAEQVEFLLKVRKEPIAMETTTGLDHMTAACRVFGSTVKSTAESKASENMTEGRKALETSRNISMSVSRVERKAQADEKAAAADSKGARHVVLYPKCPDAAMSLDEPPEDLSLSFEQVGFLLPRVMHCCWAFGEYSELHEACMHELTEIRSLCSRVLRIAAQIGEQKNTSKGNDNVGALLGTAAKSCGLAIIKADIRVHGKAATELTYTLLHSLLADRSDDKPSRAGKPSLPKPQASKRSTAENGKKSVALPDHVNSVAADAVIWDLCDLYAKGMMAQHKSSAGLSAEAALGGLFKAFAMANASTLRTKTKSEVDSSSPMSCLLSALLRCSARSMEGGAPNGSVGRGASGMYNSREAHAVDYAGMTEAILHLCASSQNKGTFPGFVTAAAHALPALAKKSLLAMARKQQIGLLSEDEDECTEDDPSAIQGRSVLEKLLCE